MTASPHEKSTAYALLSSFWAGFVTPSRFAFTLTIMTASAICLLICVGFTPGLIAGPIGAYAARDTIDSDGFATRDALRLAMIAPADKTPHVAIIGDSIIAQVLGDDGLFTRVLDDVTHRNWNVTFLTTAGQSPSDEAILADYATRRHDTVVILPLSAGRYGYTAPLLEGFYRDARLGMRSDWADREISLLGARPTLRTGIYAIDNRKFLSRNLRMMIWHALKNEPPQRRIDSYLLEEKIDADLLDKQRSAFLNGLYTPWRRDDPAIRMLAETVRNIERRGNRLIFVEVPVNQAIFRDAADARRYALYLQESAALARDLGGSYCTAAEQAENPSDYADYFHVKSIALQARLRQTIAACIAADMRPKGAT